MARRRRSILAPFGSISRNFRALITSFLGLGILGSVGYFTFLGGPVVGNINDALDIVAYGNPQVVSDIQVANDDQNRTHNDSSATVRKPVIQSKSPTEITIGTFNIQRFGDSQLGKPSVMKTLVAIVKQFDVIAIQEITDVDGEVIPRFLQLVNKHAAGQYDYVLSPRLGRETGSRNAYREQFGFIFDTTRVKIKDGPRAGFVVSKRKFGTKYDRLPTVLQFEVTAALSSTPFTFSLVNVHLVPSGNPKLPLEVVTLKDVYADVKRILPNEDDIIILGDFNSPSEGILLPMKTIAGRQIKTALEKEKTNLAQTKTYDNLMFDANDTIEFVGAKVIDFTAISESFGADPKDVSDHLPVMGSFKVHESANGSMGTVAARPMPALR